MFGHFWHQSEDEFAIRQIATLPSRPKRTVLHPAFRLRRPMNSRCSTSFGRVAAKLPGKHNVFRRHRGAVGKVARSIELQRRLMKLRASSVSIDCARLQQGRSACRKSAPSGFRSRLRIGCAASPWTIIGLRLLESAPPAPHQPAALGRGGIDVGPRGARRPAWPNAAHRDSMSRLCDNRSHRDDQRQNAKCGA